MKNTAHVLRLLVAASLIFSATAGFAQWNASTNPIYPTNLSANVGIGTQTPPVMLTLFGNGTTVARLRFGGTGIATGYQLGWSGPGAASDVEIWNFENTAFRFATSGVERMRIAANGFVGIGTGTSTPQTLLELKGDQVNSVARLRFSGTGLNAGGYQIGFSGGGATPNVELWNFENTDYIFATNNTERMRIRGNGWIGIGTNTPTSALTVVGDASFSGTVTGGNIQAKYQDVAEWVPSASDLSAGTVVTLDKSASNQVMASTHAYDTGVAGVVSLQPGLTLGEAGKDKEMIATTGRVKVRVDASKRPIQIGDLLVTSDKSGMAMRSEPVEMNGISMHRPGTIIGKALEPLAAGQGEILVLLSMQ